MKNPPMDIVVLGLSITSSWGNGHATTYRGLIRELSKLGHSVLFLERDVPWYSANRDLENYPYARTELYENIEDLKERFTLRIREADLVIVGSYVPQGKEIGEWVNKIAWSATAFYDIDTPVTHAALKTGECNYLSYELITKYDLYLSFTGGPFLRRLEQVYGSPMARELYCSADTEVYYPEANEKKYDLGYIGTFSPDRQPVLDNLLLETARNWSIGRFVIAGPKYPAEIHWPENVSRIEHVSPGQHRKFYGSQRYTLNITRAEMVQAGYSPSIRLFEAAACGTPIISDYWEGLGVFFELGTEILVAHGTEETSQYIREIPEDERFIIAERARARVLSMHTSAHRAMQLQNYAEEALNGFRYRRESSSL